MQNENFIKNLLKILKCDSRVLKQAWGLSKHGILYDAAGHMLMKPALSRNSEGTLKGENDWFKLRAPGPDNTAIPCQFHALKGT